MRSFQFFQIWDDLWYDMIWCCGIERWSFDEFLIIIIIDLYIAYIIYIIMYIYCLVFKNSLLWDFPRSKKVIIETWRIWSEEFEEFPIVGVFLQYMLQLMFIAWTNTNTNTNTNKKTHSGCGRLHRGAARARAGGGVRPRSRIRVFQTRWLNVR